MTQASRVLELLQTLPRGRGEPGSTAASLAERLQTTVRSIFRDVALLQEAGVPIANDRQGYYLPATDHTVSVRFTADDLAALGYAAQWLRSVMPDRLQPQFDTLVGKLVAVSGTSEARIAALDGGGGVFVDPPLTDGPYALQNLNVAMHARRLQRKLRGVYWSPEHDQESERTLHPYAIVYRGHAHYLVAYCEQRKMPLTFRLDRFRLLEMLPDTADIPEDFDLAQHFSGAWEVTSGRRQTVRLLLCGKAARRLKLSQIHPSQKIVREGKDELEVELHVAVTEELRGAVLGMGPDVEVLEPRSLRQAVQDMARETIARYSR